MMTEKIKLSKKELRQIWIRFAMTSLSSSSYEKLQAHAEAYSFLPFAKRYYSDDLEAQKRLLVRHSMFYNTEPQTGQLINGIVTSLEESIANKSGVDEEMPTAIKATLMGPIAGIGDSIIQGIVIPILLSIAMGMAKDGSPMGPIFYMIAYFMIGLFISYFCFMKGYKLGVDAIDVIVGENSRHITNAFNILGIMVVGGLSANYVALTTKIKYMSGDESVKLQSVLDGVFPKILPLIMVLLAWYLISQKHLSAVKVVLILTGITTIGVLVGIF